MRKSKPIDFELAEKLFYITEDLRDDGKLVMNLRHKHDKVSKGKHVRIKKGELAGYASPRGYQKVKIGASAFTAHRVIWAMLNKVSEFPALDHIDRDKGNNHITNLRLDVDGINAMNYACKGWTISSGTVVAHWKGKSGELGRKRFGKPTPENMARAAQFAIQIRKDLWDIDIRSNT